MCPTETKTSPEFNSSVFAKIAAVFLKSPIGRWDNSKKFVTREVRSFLRQYAVIMPSKFDTLSLANGLLHQSILKNMDIKTHFGGQSRITYIVNTE